MFDTDYEKEEQEFSFMGNRRGIVVDNQDPYQRSRCKIRIYGVYDDVEDEHLPWAEYCDPFMQGQNGSGSSFIPDIDTKVWCFFENGDHMQPVYFGGAPSLKDGPPDAVGVQGDVARYGVDYSKNRVIRSPAGHTVELDDTPGDSRVRVTHKSGSQIIMYENGDVHEYVVGNRRMYVKGNLEEYIDGAVMRQITGNSTEVVDGNEERYVKGDALLAVVSNKTENVGGNSSTTVNGDSDNNVVGDYTSTTNGDTAIRSNGKGSFVADGAVNMESGTRIDISTTGDVYIDGSNIYINCESPSAESVDSIDPVEDFEPSDDFANSVENAAVLIEVAGPKAAWDEEGESIPANWPAENVADPVESPTEITTEDNTEIAPLSAECENITSIDYNYRLSENYTLGMLSRGALFPHGIRAQNGLSVSQIICNLKHLCVNVLEPLRAKFPNIRINSGFRAGSGGSQHNKGQAVDIQVPGASPRVYSDMAAWIVKNIPYDQFIFEHGNSVWLHISYNHSNQRRQRLTYYPKKSPAYQAGLKNYYDNGRVIT